MNQLARLEYLIACMTRGSDDLFGHTHRVADLAHSMGIAMGLDAVDLDTVRLAGLLHDIGKLDVDSKVLSKPGPLNGLEMGEIRRHPGLGFDLVRDLVPSSVARAILHHHERWDGDGYPYRLAGTEIPTASRIILVVDAFDAMTSPRCYQPALDTEWALEEITVNRATQFDPGVADLFVDGVRSGRFASGTDSPSSRQVSLTG